MRHFTALAGALFSVCAAFSFVECVGDAPSASPGNDSGVPLSDATSAADGSSSVDASTEDRPAIPSDAGSNDGGSTDAAPDAALPPLAIVPSIGVGFGFACTGRANGRVYCWGKNDVGQFGNLLTSATPTPTPAQVAQITTAARVVTGSAFACALLTDHTVMCWGNNSQGSLGHPIAADAPKTYSATPTAIAGLSDVVEIGAGSSYACARKADSSVWCWGDNTSQELGHSNATDPACVGSTLCSATPTRVGTLQADALAIGFAHACARVGTSAYCWGDNSYAQLGHVPGQSGDVGNKNPTPTQAAATNVGALYAGGGYVTCMVDPTNAASCWGSDSSGQLGDNAAVATSAAPVAIAGLAKTVGKVVPSYGNACATMGTLAGVWCWGDNSQGGDGLPDAASGAHSAAAVTGFASKTIGDIAGGPATANWCAIESSTGDVYCWGININDELGHANTSDGTCQGQKCDPTPTKVQGLP